MKILKGFLYVAAMIGVTVPAMAAPRDLADMKARYGFVASTNADEMSGIFANVGDKTTFTTILNNYRSLVGAPLCTELNGCLHFEGANGTPGLPVDDPASTAEAAYAMAAISVAAPHSALRVISTSGKSGTVAAQAIATFLASPSDGAIMGFGIGSTDPAQSTISTALAANAAKVLVAPQGALTSSLVVQVGGSQYVPASAEATWSTTTADVFAVAHQLPTASGSIDSTIVPCGLILGRLEAQSGGIAIRSDLLAAAASHFGAVSGATTGRGRFVDGSNL